MSNKQISLTVKLNVDGKEQLVTATTDVEKLRAALDASQGSISKAFKNLSYLSASFLGISSAANQVCGTLNRLTEESRSFGGAMAAANTMAGKSGKDFEQLKDKVADLAAELPIARDQLANGLYQVVSMGVPEDNWIDYLKKSAKASIGGIADLGETVKVTATVIKNYGLEWDKANDVQDKIQLTAKLGSTSFEQLAQSLPMVTGNAATLGVSIDDLLASFATLTGVSGNTAEVATQLSAIFTSLVKPSSEATKQAQEMGIQFDAAAIKAAGGMRNFLVDLDKNVKAYAQRTGQIETAIYSRLFGSARAMRALIPLTGKLSDKFGKDAEKMKNSAGTIDDAFGIMSGTGSAKIQKLKNAIADMTDGITSKLSVLRPALNISAEVGNTVVAVFAMKKALKAFGVTALWTAVRFKGLNFAVSFGKQTLKDLRAVVTVVTTTMRGAAVSADIMKSAIRGLLVTSVVGLAIWALSAAIGYLIGKMDEAEDGMNGMSEAEQQAKQATEQMNKEIANVRTEYDLNIQKLKEFKGSKEDERKLVEEMNGKYGESFGYYSTVADWYTALVTNSKAYCDQMVKEIELRKLANDVASAQADMDKLRLDENGKVRRYSTYRKLGKVTDGIAYNPQTGTSEPKYKWVPEVGSSEVEQVQAKFDEARRRRDAAKKRMYALNGKDTGTIKHTKGWRPDRANTPVSGGKANGTNKADRANRQEPKTLVGQWRDELSRLEKEKENALTVDAKVKIDEKIGTLQKKIDEATKGKVSIGAEVEPTYITQGSTADKRQSHSNAESRASRIQQDYEIGIIGKEDAERQLNDLNEQLKALGLKPVEIHFKSHVEELQDALQKAQKELEDGTTVEAKIEAAVKVQKLQAEIDAETHGQLTIQAEIEPTYVTKGSATDKRQSYENAMQRANKLKSDVEIGLIGADDARTQLKAINEQLDGLGLKPIKMKIDADVSSFDEAMSNIKEGWSNISGIGSGIESITSALEGNKNGWQAISSVVQGAISVMEGIRGIVSMIKIFTAVTKAQKVATDESTTSTLTNAAAAGVNASAKGGEAVANATASGAKLPFPYNLVAIAAGVAAVVAALATITGGFATGGVVGGSSTHGDRKFARVNSGEMILNKSQQTRLFNLIDGRFTPPSIADRRMQPVVVQLPHPMTDATPQVNITMNADARRILEVMSDVNKVASVSGRRYF